MKNSDSNIHPEIRDIVRDNYGEIARAGGCCSGISSCCGGPSPEEVAKVVGYSPEELKTLPEGANMGLSCGNPSAIASLKTGEVVLDLGSGGGFDVFIAAGKVGETGRAIGVDMTPDMLQKARKSIAQYTQRTGLSNIEFRLGEIEHLPIADNSIDVVISNCVINLSPEKAQVWSEIARVLKPGGRVAVSDLALLKPLPDSIKESMEALVGCIAGAVLVNETKQMISDAGLINAEFEMKSEYIDSMSDWSDPLYRKIAEELPEGAKASDYVTSLSIKGNKAAL